MTLTYFDNEIYTIFRVFGAGKIRQPGENNQFYQNLIIEEGESLMTEK